MCQLHTGGCTVPGVCPQNCISHILIPQITGPCPVVVIRKGGDFLISKVVEGNVADSYHRSHQSYLFLGFLAVGFLAVGFFHVVHPSATLCLYSSELESNSSEEFLSSKRVILDILIPARKRGRFSSAQLTVRGQSINRVETRKIDCTCDCCSCRGDDHSGFCSECITKGINTSSTHASQKSHIAV